MIAKKIGIFFLIVSTVCILIMLVIVLIILFNSSGKVKPLIDQDGNISENSLSEKSCIEIDGKKLWFFIKSSNISNPVLLYLHGGMPDYFLTQNYPTGLEELFTVVWWDQRGAGLSANAIFEDKAITIENMIEDTRVISEYLKDRFSKNKIYLMGHSGGSYLGIKVIERFPELYHAYMGIAQISNQKLSEKLAYDYILSNYKKIKKSDRVFSVLKKHPVVLNEPIPHEYLKIRDYAMHALGIGTMKNMRDIMTGIFIPSLLFREYSIRDKILLWKGKVNSGVSVFWDEMIYHDLSEENLQFEIPVYFFHGIYDYTCSFELSRLYYEKINAPEKKFFTFNESSHSPIFEEPEKCIRLIREEVVKSY